MKRYLERLMVCGIGVLLFASFAWARKYALTTSSIIPAAKGDVNARLDKNGNALIYVSVEHLAQPSSLKPPGTVYIVWFEQQGQPAANEGQLKVGSNLKGDFKGETPMKTFEIFATAENDAMTKTPTGQQIFHATVQL